MTEIQGRTRELILRSGRAGRRGVDTVQDWALGQAQRRNGYSGLYTTSGRMGMG